jgi:Ribbon-helix-helix protein, copG family
MAMTLTLTLTDEETALLRRQAEREGRSMHEVVKLAIQKHIAHHNHTERVEQAAHRVVTRHGEILDRLQDG